MKTLICSLIVMLSFSFLTGCGTRRIPSPDEQVQILAQLDQKIAWEEKRGEKLIKLTKVRVDLKKSLQVIKQKVTPVRKVSSVRINSEENRGFNYFRNRNKRNRRYYSGGYYNRSYYSSRRRHHHNSNNQLSNFVVKSHVNFLKNPFKNPFR